MPFYDYKCLDDKCNHVMLDQMKKFDDKIIDCESCGGQSERQFSGRFAAHGLPNGHNAVRVRK